MFNGENKERSLTRNGIAYNVPDMKQSTFSQGSFQVSAIEDNCWHKEETYWTDGFVTSPQYAENYPMQEQS